MRKLCDRVSCGRTFRVFLKELIMYTFDKIFMRQGMLLGYFVCDRILGVERFATHPRHFLSQITPPPGLEVIWICFLISSRVKSPSTTEIEKKEETPTIKDNSKPSNASLQTCSLMVDMEEDYMEDYPMDEGDDTDEFEDIENEDENDPDELYERTLEVSLFVKESASFCTKLLPRLIRPRRGTSAVWRA